MLYSRWRHCGFSPSTTWHTSNSRSMNGCSRFSWLSTLHIMKSSCVNTKLLASVGRSPPSATAVALFTLFSVRSRSSSNTWPFVRLLICAVLELSLATNNRMLIISEISCAFSTPSRSTSNTLKQNLLRSTLGPRQAALTPQHSSLKSMWPSRFSSNAAKTPLSAVNGTGGLISGDNDSKSSWPVLAWPFSDQNVFSKSPMSCQNKQKYVCVTAFMRLAFDMSTFVYLFLQMRHSGQALVERGRFQVRAEVDARLAQQPSRQHRCPLMLDDPLLELLEVHAVRGAEQRQQYALRFGLGLDRGRFGGLHRVRLLVRLFDLQGTSELMLDYLRAGIVTIDIPQKSMAANSGNDNKSAISV